MARNTTKLQYEQKMGNLLSKYWGALYIMFIKNRICSFWINKAIIFSFVFIFIVSACTPITKMPKISDEMAAYEAERQRRLALKELISLQRRLQNVGFRILMANTLLCKNKVRFAYGFTFLTIENVHKDFRDAYSYLFGVRKFPTVLNVIPGSPAEKAGLKVGDVIIAVNNMGILPGKRGMNKLITILRENKGDPLKLSVERGNKNYEFIIKPVKICDYEIELQNSDEVNAFADGRRVVVFSGMMRFLKSDDELALIIGHELAHNIMGHIKKQAVNRTIGAIFGAILSALTGVNMTETGADIGQLAFSQEFEAEADYVGCYCAARAGYNVSKAAQLWRRIAATHPSAINLKGTTHPSTAKRFIAIQKTVEEIKQKIENKQPLIPEGESHYNN